MKVYIYIYTHTNIYIYIYDNIILYNLYIYRKIYLCIVLLS